jgi:hypothetical protein
MRIRKKQLTTLDVQRELNVGYWTVLRWRKAGLLVGTRGLARGSGTPLRFDRAEVDRFRAEHIDMASATPAAGKG